MFWTKARCDSLCKRRFVMYRKKEPIHVNDFNLWEGPTIPAHQPKFFGLSGALARSLALPPLPQSVCCQEINANWFISSCFVLLMGYKTGERKYLSGSSNLGSSEGSASDLAMGGSSLYMILTNHKCWNTQVSQQPSGKQPCEQPPEKDY